MRVMWLVLLTISAAAQEKQVPKVVAGAASEDGLAAAT